MADEVPWYAPFCTWWDEAHETEPRVPDALQVATVDASGQPSLRTVLLKEHDPSGFVFYTHLQSRKGRALEAEPRVAACLHWKSRERQVLIEGRVEQVSDAQADAYFATRPRGSQLGAWASDQSEPLPHDDALSQRMAAAEARFDGVPVPRPPGWSGFRILPTSVELWQGCPDRLHVRRKWTLRDGQWAFELLAP